MHFENQFIQSVKFPIQIFGVDEVGRGPLAGPVCACALSVEINSERDVEQWQEWISELQELKVTDSKKLTDKKREMIVSQLKIDLASNKKLSIHNSKNLNVSYYIQEISHTQIDQINILRASLLAMEMAVSALAHDENHLMALIDGNKKFETKLNVDQFPIVKGDSKSTMIGLASIIAKVYRDQLMQEMGRLYPGYGLENHAGYPTKDHLQAIVQLGVLDIHRKTFKGVKEHVQTGAIQ